MLPRRSGTSWGTHYSVQGTIIWSTQLMSSLYNQPLSTDLCPSFLHITNTSCISRIHHHYQHHITVYTLQDSSLYIYTLYTCYCILHHGTTISVLTVYSSHHPRAVNIIACLIFTKSVMSVCCRCIVYAPQEICCVNTVIIIMVFFTLSLIITWQSWACQVIKEVFNTVTEMSSILFIAESCLLLKLSLSYLIKS